MTAMMLEMVVNSGLRSTFMHIPTSHAGSPRRFTEPLAPRSATCKSTFCSLCFSSTSLRAISSKAAEMSKPST